MIKDNNSTFGAAAGAANEKWLVSLKKTLSNMGVTNYGGATFSFADLMNVSLTVEGTVTSQSAVGVDMGAALGTKLKVGPEGTIDAETQGVLSNSDGAKITNAGLVTSASSHGVELNGDAVKLVNKGTISTLDDEAYAVVQTGDLGVVVNKGVMSGALEAFIGYTDVEDTNSTLFTNFKTIIGSVRLDGGDDAFINKKKGFVDGTVNLGAGNDRFVGGNKSDIVRNFESGELTLGKGDDTLDFSNTPYEFVAYGGAGDDAITASTNANGTVYGEAGDDLITVTSDEYVIVHGGIGDDVITGGDGYDDLAGYTIHSPKKLPKSERKFSDNDTIDGGGGEDDIVGGEGDDTLTGGADADNFWFDLRRNDGHDTITDFEIGLDQIRFQNKGKLDGAFADHVLITVNGGDAYVVIGADPTNSSKAKVILTFEGLAGQITESDFNW